jgi:hypothetical protein
MYSTPYLHWACHPGRRLVTLEDHSDWKEFVEKFKTPYHEVRFVTDWDTEDLSEPWSIAFVDHDPVEKRLRAKDVARLTHADYVVCHDAENKSDHKYGYSSVNKLFKYRWKYTGAGMPFTAVFSNKYELRGI